MAAFSNKNVKRMVDTIDIIMDCWIEQTLRTPIVSHGKGVDILDEMCKITANVITEAAFDYQLSDDEHIAFLNNLRTCWDEFFVQANGNILRNIPYLRVLSPGVRRGKRAAAKLYQQCEIMMIAYRTKVAKNGPSVRQPHKLIDIIMNDTEYENDKERVRDMVAYVIAGFDTTANTLSFALLELARHPQEQIKLRTALRKYDTEEDARSCTELKYVIRETLRLRPAVALGVVRLLRNDVKISVQNGDENKVHDMILPSGSVTLPCTFAIQRDAKVFDNPDEFMPSRWEDPSEEMSKSMVVFALGRRNCQGQALAYAEMTDILLKLCRDYEISVVDEGRAANVALYKPLGTILSFTKATNKAA